MIASIVIFFLIVTEIASRSDGKRIGVGRALKTEVMPDGKRLVTIETDYHGIHRVITKCHPTFNEEVLYREVGAKIVVIEPSSPEFLAALHKRRNKK
jgi:hypothetical protein